MVIYTCNICNKNFNKKSNYINHTEKKKTPCKSKNNINLLPITSELNLKQQNAPKLILQQQNAPEIDQNKLQISNIILNKSIYECNYCKSSFTRSTTLKRHLLERCKVRKEENKDKEDLLQLLLKQTEQINLLIEDNKMAGILEMDQYLITSFVGVK